MTNYNVEINEAVITIHSKGGFGLFATSDVHFDSIYCDRSTFFNDLIIAKENNANIFIFGDFFDAMQGRFDPRRDMEKVRPEYRRTDYYDALVEDAAEKLEPYADNILLLAEGNHETSVIKNAGTNLTKRLAILLSTKKHKVHSARYGGIILIKDDGYTIPGKFFHGSGGEAPVTRGAIQTNRQAVFMPDFNFVINGHSHHMYWMPIQRERVNDDGIHYFDIQHHFRTPGYVNTYGDGTTGWEVTRGGVPKPMGSWLIQFRKDKIYPTPFIHSPKPISSVLDMYDGVVFPQE